ncbi:proline dehydrogenase [Lentibacillus halophilus]|uniref:proline dehydrogenase n=1 Tax=Lentibacillus halophilus TaxID=295065 RepID=A0ABN0ZH36_9BACI
MTTIIRNVFIGLSNSKFLNSQAKKWGFFLGADKFVAGTTISGVVETVKELNAKGISCTLDNLGEFAVDKQEATEAKAHILEILNAIDNEQLDCHLSVKLTQLGLNLDQQFCIDTMKDILEVAERYDIFVNIDMEHYSYYEMTLDVLDALREQYNNVGTVIQSYLYRAVDDLARLNNVRIRIVKGAYKEDSDVAYQDNQDIDRHFITLAKHRLLGDTFTSIATHDHRIINELKTFVDEHGISTDRFEFQMLYGFRNDMQEKLAREGYPFCTYIPFGRDWFGYFMRRLAERPQNINLMLKDALYTEDNTLKTWPVIAGSAIAATAAVVFWRRKR